eukprot:g61027.t1
MNSKFPLFSFKDIKIESRATRLLLGRTLEFGTPSESPAVVVGEGLDCQRQAQFNDSRTAHVKCHSGPAGFYQPFSTRGKTCQLCVLLLLFLVERIVNMYFHHLSLLFKKTNCGFVSTGPACPASRALLQHFPSDIP